MNAVGRDEHRWYSLRPQFQLYLLSAQLEAYELEYGQVLQLRERLQH